MLSTAKNLKNASLYNRFIGTNDELFCAEDDYRSICLHSCFSKNSQLRFLLEFRAKKPNSWIRLFFAQFTQKRVKSERGQKVEEKFVCLTLTLLIVVRNWGHEELCNGLKVFLASQKSILCPRQDGKRAVRIAASYANYARCTHYPEYTSYTNVALHQA